MKYKCLILDHDDTVVKTTPEVHFPSFKETLRRIRPQLIDMTLEQFVNYCFDPGFYSLCVDILKLTKEEKEKQYFEWLDYNKTKIPDCYEGLGEFIKEFVKDGGRLCVASHSDEQIIRRDYLHHFELEPDLVFGWGERETHRKPYPYPIEEAHKRLSIPYGQMLVVDDLKPGYTMAKRAGVKFAYAGWSSSDKVKEVNEFMRQNADYCFFDIKDLKNLIFEKVEDR